MKYPQRRLSSFLLVVSLIALSMGATSVLIKPSSDTSPTLFPPRLTPRQESYTWIWDTFENAPGHLSADDPVLWGSSLGPYLNYLELTEKLQTMETCFPEIVDVFSIGQSWQGRDIWVLRLTNETNTQSKTEFLLVAHHHGREAITIINALYFVDRLLELAANGNSSVLSLLNAREIYVVPSLNPDSLSCLSVNPWQRKNLHSFDEDGDGTIIDEFEIDDANGDGYVSQYYYSDGSSFLEGIDGSDADSIAGEDAPGGVDLNRNYDWDFSGPYSSTAPAAEDFRGTGPFSEPETLAMRNLVQQHDFNYALSLHSGTFAVTQPWGYTDDPPPDAVEINAIVGQLKALSGYPSWEDSAGYLVSGEWGDWCYGKEGIFAFTLETYGDAGSWEETNHGDYYEDRGVWDLFNPPANQAIDSSEPVFDCICYLSSEPHETITNALPLVVVGDPYVDGANVTVEWTVSDPDSSYLLSSVYFSSDGLLWDLQAENLTTEVYTIPNLPQGIYWLKVSVSDGIDAVMDIADQPIIVGSYVTTTVNPSGMVSSGPGRSTSAFWTSSSLSMLLVLLVVPTMTVLVRHIRRDR